MDLFSDQRLLDATDKLPFTKLAHYTLSCIMYSMGPLPWLLACLAFVKPDLPDFWTSLSAHPRKLGLATRVVLALLQCHIGLLICDMGLLVSVSGHPFLFSVLDLLRVMRWVEERTALISVWTLIFIFLQTSAQRFFASPHQPQTYVCKRMAILVPEATSVGIRVKHSVRFGAS